VKRLGSCGLKSPQFGSVKASSTTELESPSVCVFAVGVETYEGVVQVEVAPLRSALRLKQASSRRTLSMPGPPAPGLPSRKSIGTCVLWVPT